METTKPVEALRAGLTISVEAVVDAIAPGEPQLARFIEMIRGSDDDAIKAVFRSATKAETEAEQTRTGNANAKAVGPLVGLLMVKRNMVKESAQKRASEAKAIVTAWPRMDDQQREKLASLGYHKAVGMAVQINGQHKETTQAARIGSEIGTTFYAMQKQHPNADARQLMGAAEKAVKENNAKAEWTSKVASLAKRAKELGLYLTPAGMSPQQYADHLVRSETEAFVGNLPQAITVKLAELAEARKQAKLEADEAAKSAAAHAKTEATKAAEIAKTTGHSVTAVDAVETAQA